ncbi:precorrin-2 dehydrogenase/sirohydrochlorin ferrochelatase family protein [Arcobacter sp.]|jgi:precorrin-2 dehydrogenase/sirohydrochlorin ferrochelatase|uniref:precorrin-2 dehydrogenase/sirohydrochlorin ferrochelatase family protein n=1 Tax=Arcobacter sp. TaxID=1872629 RepID=UPI003C7124BC
MSNFPISLNLENRKILVIGAGKIATSKVKKLLDFTNDIVVLAPNISEELEKLHIKTLKKEYEKNDIEGFHIVIACIDDINLQKEIYKHTREKNILYNCADIYELCDFTFSSIIKKDDLVITISTSGSSPAFSKELKMYLEKIIPNSVGSFLKNMKNLRATMPKGEERMEISRKKSKEFISSMK